MSKEIEKEENNFTDSLADLCVAFSKEVKENPIKIEDDFEYPMEISGIKKGSSISICGDKAGTLVKIRPVADEYKNKTYLGIYMGDIPVGINVCLYEKTKILGIVSNTNPAIFVPELKKVIYGYESWWGKIKSEEELKEITDNDIDNVWYVKMLKETLKKEKDDK